MQLCNSAYGAIHVLRNDNPRGMAICQTGKAPDHDDIMQLAALLSPGMIAVDAGANFGCFALAFAAAGALVYAFEPQPQLADLLLRSVHLGHADVIVYHAALGAQVGEIKMPTVDYTSEMDFGTVRLGAGQHTVDVMTLDQLLLPCLDVLKIDVEGMELEVLRGGEKTIREYHPVIFVEHHISGKPALETKLREFGYTQFHWNERDMLCTRE